MGFKGFSYAQDFWNSLKYIFELYSEEQFFLDSGHKNTSGGIKSRHVAVPLYVYKIDTSIINNRKNTTQQTFQEGDSHQNSRTRQLGR